MSPSESDAAPHAVRLEILGQVQGVGYRDWLCGEARRLGLAGWVRNRRDGAVLALLQGGRDAVAEGIAACRRGPAAARVGMVREERVGAETLGDFIRLPDA